MAREERESTQSTTEGLTAKTTKKNYTFLRREGKSREERERWEIHQKEAGGLSTGGKRGRREEKRRKKKDVTLQGGSLAK